MDILAHWPLHFPKETLSLGRAHNIILPVIEGLQEEGTDGRDQDDKGGGREGQKGCTQGSKREGTEE